MGLRFPWLLLLVWAGTLALAAPVQGQADPGDVARSVHLPADHWVNGVLFRADVFGGEGDSGVWGFGTVSREDVLRALGPAPGREFAGGIRSHRSSDPTPEQRRLLAAYRARFLEEMEGAGGGSQAGGLRWHGGRFDLRVGEGTPALGPGSGGLGGHDPVPPLPMGAPDPVVGSMAGSLSVGPLLVAGEVRSQTVLGPRVPELHVAGGLGPLDLWLGRRAPSLGGSAGGTLVLSGSVPLDGGGLRLSDPVVLPSFLRHLGPVRFETHLARFREHGHVDGPWFWTARGSISPHPRLGLAVNRGAVFGGDPAPAVTFREVAMMVLGMRRDEADDGFGRTAFANQVVSLEARYRLSTGRFPTSVYLEWGAEDSAGSWWHVPGIVAGVHLASVPGRPEVSLGLERAHFAEACCGNPEWYRHHHFSGGWAYRGAPLGHPLGGHGDEWRLHGRADLLQARFRSSWAVFHRERGHENLYAPDREGRGVGGELRVRYRLTPWMDLLFDGQWERAVDGGGWKEGRGFFGVRTFF